MKTSFSKFTLLTSVIASAYTLNSCKEDAYTSPDLIPTVDNIRTFELNADDLDVEYTVSMKDSIVTNDPSLPIVSAGSMWADPFFGTIDNELYFQVTIPSLNFKFPAGAKIDSAFVTLPYSRISYGDSTTENSYDLHLVQDNSFRADPTSVRYYNNSSVNISSSPIGSYTGVLSKLDTDTITYPSKDTLINQMRIKIDAPTLDYIKTMDSTHTRNNSTFTKFLNGFCIRPSTASTSSQKKSLQYFILDPINATSNLRRARLEVHYRENDTVMKVIAFPFSSRYSGFFTRSMRGYNGYMANMYNVTGQSMDSILITGRPGFDTDIKISNLLTIPKSVINLGRITIKLPKENSKLLPPDLLTVTGLDNDKKEIVLPDYGVTGDNSTLSDLAKKFVGGTRQSRKIDNVDYWVYEINIPRSIQKAVHDGSNTLSLRLNAYTIYPGAYRMVVPAKASLGNNGVNFSIIYTKI